MKRHRRQPPGSANRPAAPPAGDDAPRGGSARVSGWAQFGIVQLFLVMLVCLVLAAAVSYLVRGDFLVFILIVLAGPILLTTFISLIYGFFRWLNR